MNEIAWVLDPIEEARYIDSRNVIGRIAFLRQVDKELKEANERGGLDEIDAAELAALIQLVKAAGPYSEDWEGGATLIRSDEFENYARELAEDIGAIGRDNPWPTSHIDWEAAADELKQDFAAVDFGSSTYYVG